MAVPIYNMTDTWTNAGTTYTAIKMNVTDTASAAASLLIDLQIGSVSQFAVGKTGTIFLPSAGAINFNNGDVTLTHSSDALTLAGGSFFNTRGTITASDPFTITQTWNNSGVTFTGMLVNITNSASGGSSRIADFQEAGTSYLQVRRSGAVRLGDGIAGIGAGLTTLAVYSGGSIGFSSTVDPLGTPDIYLYRDAANTLALRNGTSVQTFNVYDTYTDASNYVRFGIVAENGGGQTEFGTYAAGTGLNTQHLTIKVQGTNRQLIFNLNGADRWKFDGSSNLVASTDDAYDIGASGATRPRTAYIGTSIVLGTSTNISTLTSPGANIFGIGGSSSSFPAIKRNSAGIDFRLADDSAYAAISALRYMLSGGPGIYSGTGDPEGVVTAAQGSLFMRTDGGTDTTLYTKNSGSSNTGWVAVDNV